MIAEPRRFQVTAVEEFHALTTGTGDARKRHLSTVTVRAVLVAASGDLELAFPMKPDEAPRVGQILTVTLTEGDPL